MFSKKDIEKARENNALRQAKEQLGDHITDLNQVEILNHKKPSLSLGQRLVNINKRHK